MYDPATVGRKAIRGIEEVREFRKQHGDAYYYNWLLKIRHEFQQPFQPTHENMRRLRLEKGIEIHMLAGDLRRAFSGIVAGNVKETGLQSIEENGLFELYGDMEIMEPLDNLLKAFVEQGRMKLPSDTLYSPCYRILKVEKKLRN